MTLGGEHPVTDTMSLQLIHQRAFLSAKHTHTLIRLHTHTHALITHTHKITAHIY